MQTVAGLALKEEWQVCFRVGRKLVRDTRSDFGLFLVFDLTSNQRRVQIKYEKQAEITDARQQTREACWNRLKQTAQTQQTLFHACNLHSEDATDFSPLLLPLLLCCEITHERPHAPYKRYQTRR